jgi:superfamily II DNA or RNA helicase
MNYSDFLKTKELADIPTGLADVPELPAAMFDFQRDIARWALKRGRAAIFADCGMGKTLMQLVWADTIRRETGNSVLILAPLAVATQTVREGARFGIDAKYCRRQEDAAPITIANYEMLDHFDPSRFGGIVLDESSILKSYSGKFRNQVIESFAATPYRLACTATPAPNDHMELGNHAEFLGVMTRTEMLSMFFVHDGGDTSSWRIKGHAESEFWKWVCSWAVMIRRPSDLGYQDGAFVLPSLKISEQVVSCGDQPAEGLLFRMPAATLQERQKERKLSTGARVQAAADLAKEGQWLIWCDLNEESRQLARAIDGAIEVVGADKPEKKEQAALDFASGKIRVLVSKPSIFGFGLNFQHCHKMAFVGLSDSYEQFYQAVRRCWRFGQKEEVECHVITAETEGAVVANIKRKEADANRMAEEMVRHMKSYNEASIKGSSRERDTYRTQTAAGDKWTLYLGDCVEGVRALESDSVHYSIFSPPFASLYTYSNSIRDMGNCKGEDEFLQQFMYLIEDLFRVMKPGRLVSFHCMNLPSIKCRDGEIGIKDFRGDLVWAFVRAGFIFHSEVCIWKDPVTAMQRTKAIGLLHKQLCKDSCMSRQAIPDYLVTMRKPGTNPEPVAGELDYFCGDGSFKSTGRLSIDIWQRYASPVWMDINPSRTLQKESARDEKDERHICPLQLDVIERGIQLWSNPGDLVLSPFAGIGSEGHVAIKTGRRFVGFELKDSYWRQASKNLEAAEKEAKQERLL